jgi:beta-lactamase class A
MMRRGGPDLLRWISIGLLLAAVTLFFFELVSFSRIRSRLPEGMTIGGVPVGGLDQETAVEQLLKVYSTPVELHYGDQAILLAPASIGFQLDTESMIAAAELGRTGTGFWPGFWDFLWNRPGQPTDIPLRSDYSRTQLEGVLRDIAARYDQPPVPVEPLPGSPNFTQGVPGRVMDIGRAMDQVAAVLDSPVNRRLNLPVAESQPPRPTLATLQTLLEQNIDVAGFNGLVDLYLMDLRTGDELHFAYFRNHEIPATPDIAFTAASTIKIPVMVTYLANNPLPLDSEADTWLKEMITLSGNDPADRLMQRLDQVRGPLIVSEMMQKLGLNSTFLAGYFKFGSDLLKAFRTPGNQRLDVNTRPDIYNQTTPSEMGTLMADIYRCSNGGGGLLAALPGQLSPDKCRLMLDLLSQNKIGVLIEAGVPDGTRVAHKHGWYDSPLTWVGDAGVVYTPGGDYVLSVFLWNDPDMIWDPTSKLVAELSRAVYNYFNPPS